MLMAVEPRHAMRNLPAAMAAVEVDVQSVQKRLRTMLRAELCLHSDTQPLSVHMSAYAGRNLRFAALRFSPHLTASPGAAADPDSRVLVSLHRSGDAVVAQGGRENSIPAGSMFVLDPTHPFKITTGTIETHSVYLPRSAVTALVPQIDLLTALPIPCDDGPGAILRAAIGAMFECAGSLDEASADRLAEALPHLLAPALLKAAGAQPLPTRLRQMHLQQIRRYVREHLADCNLDPAMVAKAVQLSPRHLHDLFTGEPEPLMKWVWSERLQRCHRDLAEPRLSQRTISAIAYAWGFNDISHFSRSFKAKFGVSPREHRRRCLELQASVAAP